MAAELISAFFLGLLTPLTALCVLPLYPGFLAYLSKQMTGERNDKKTLILSGIFVALGVIVFMFLLGIIFTTFLQVSLTNVINIVSPIAFALLGLISILLIFNVNFGKFFPKVHAPLTKNPLLSAFVFGFFFGAIVVPCNPAFIAALFAQALATASGVTNMFAFLAFGVGISAPLLVFSLISTKASTSIIGWLGRHQRKINLIAGILMLLIAVYYLICVFAWIPLPIDPVCKSISITFSQAGSFLLNLG